MTHFFNVEIAKRYGVEKAVIIQHFVFWIAKNAANRANARDGRYWTYNSASALCELFPYLSEDKIQRHLKCLVDSGFLLKELYNKTAMDRTAWYAFTDDAECIMQKCGIDTAILRNGLRNSAEPIPDIITDLFTDSSVKENSIKESSTKKFVKPTVEEVAEYVREKNYSVDAESFVSYYESNGWMIGRSPMKNWRAAVVTWQKKESNKKDSYGKTYGRAADGVSHSRVNHDWSQDHSDF